MSRFYASIQGSRGEATRQGHGHIQGHVRGWNLGVRVTGHDKDGQDAFEVYATGGSNASHASEHLGTVVVGSDGRPTFVPARKNFGKGEGSSG